MLSQIKNGQKGKRKFWLLLFLGIAAVLCLSFYFKQDIRVFWLLGKVSHRSIIDQTAKKYCVDSRLIIALIIKESSFKVNCVGKAGEVGLMQIMPDKAAKDWARIKKVQELTKGELMNPALNIEVGTWYLSQALRRWKDYDQSIELALCEYNAGIVRAKKWKPKSFDGDVMSKITISSTKHYVKQIMKTYNFLKKKDF